LFWTGFTGFKEQDLGYRDWDLGNNNRVFYRDGQDIQDKRRRGLGIEIGN
jgi:hypothetical protein